MHEKPYQRGFVHEKLHQSRRSPAQGAETETGGAGYGNRTRLSGLGSLRTTTVLIPLIIVMESFEKELCPSTWSSALEEVRTVSVG